MKKIIFIIALVLTVCSTAMADNQASANNQIFYTSSDGNVVTPNIAGIKTNTYENGQGIITFNSEITSIKEYAFDKCSTLTSIILPSGVQSIGVGAFRDCENLTEIFLLGTTPPSIGEKAFDSIAEDAVFVIPDETKDTYKNSGWSNLNLITFSEYKQQKEDDIILPNELKDFLTSEEIQDFETYKSNFQNASTQVDAYLWKVRAMGIIAVAEIRRDMGSDRNITYLNYIIKPEMAAIRTAETEADINRIKSAISAKLVEGRNKYDIYQEVVAEEFGSLLIRKNGPAIEGESEDGQTIQLYNIENVKFGKEE